MGEILLKSQPTSNILQISVCTIFISQDTPFARVFGSLSILRLEFLTAAFIVPGKY